LGGKMQISGVYMAAARAAAGAIVKQPLYKYLFPVFHGYFDEPAARADDEHLNGGAPRRQLRDCRSFMVMPVRAPNFCGGQVRWAGDFAD